MKFGEQVNYGLEKSGLIFWEEWSYGLGLVHLLLAGNVPSAI